MLMFASLMSCLQDFKMKNKKMTILYTLHGNLYVNLTNRCPCACTFCLRQKMDSVSEDTDSLWLEHEPSFDEIKEAFKKYDMSKFDEVVFCGFGEPTERLPELLQTAKYLKQNFANKVRINTNGMANLIWQRDTTPEFEGLVDTISISLNTPNPKRYQEIVRCKFGEKSFNAMLEFAGNVRKYVPNVVLSTVETTLTKEEEKECAEICKKLGVTYRIRAWE